jgi:hypothetical protein
VSASPSGKGEAFIGDLFNFDFNTGWPMEYKKYIKNQFVPGGKHTTSPLQSPTG